MSILISNYSAQFILILDDVSLKLRRVNKYDENFFVYLIWNILFGKYVSNYSVTKVGRLHDKI